MRKCAVSKKMSTCTEVCLLKYTLQYNRKVRQQLWRHYRNIRFMAEQAHRATGYAVEYRVTWTSAAALISHPTKGSVPSAAPCTFLFHRCTLHLHQYYLFETARPKTGCPGVRTILPFTTVELYLQRSACTQTNQYKHTFSQKTKKFRRINYLCFYFS